MSKDRRKEELEAERRDQPDPDAGDWMDWEGLTIPDWGHALVDVRGGTVRISVWDAINNRDVILTVLPEQAVEFADWVESAAAAAAENLAGIPPRPQPD
ncbi:hypothetical protein [Nocardia altamirensis]|uniref:hypothetical protein n=1 Tax=Nocardia altamirensis TaxID=472158 RepID=UPI00084023EA|nr:hypothetical protein [Nocardia altamirensis]